ncbi:MAG: amino acid adenylation domain-containing protein, partial [Acidobacteriota bacterium]
MTNDGLAEQLTPSAKRELLTRLLAERAAASSLPHVRHDGTASAGTPAGGIPRSLRTGSARPLSFAQHRLWFFDQLTPGTSVYNIHFGLRLTGPLDLEILSRALAGIVRRHDALRSRFEARSGTPVQVVNDDPPPPLALFDLRSLAADTREAEAIRLEELQASQPFDLSTGPLFRPALLQLADHVHVLLVTMHHIVSDGTSAAIVVRELTALYEHGLGVGPGLPELAIQYGDFAEWQRGRAESDPAFDAQLAFWTARLGGDLPTLDLPTDFPRPAAQTFRGGTHIVFLPPGLAGGLKALSRQQGATSFMTLLAAFQLLLSRWSGQTDVIVGSPVSGRSRPESEALIGCFINTVALRTDLSGSPTFVQLLERVRAGALDAYANQDVPFDRLVEQLHPPRDRRRTPVFQVLFNMLGADNAWRTRWRDVDVEPTAPLEEPSKFDLTVYAGETGDTLYLRAVYNADLFSAARIEELTRQLVQLLERIVAAPAKPIGAYSLVTPAATKVLPDGITVLERRWHGDVVARVREHARATPDRIALAYGGTEWTYAELLASSHDVAVRLASAGIGPDDLVAVHARRAPELVAALLGIWECGAAFLVLDPAYPAARLTQYLEAARPKAWISIGVDAPEPLRAAIDGLGLRSAFTVRGKLDRAAAGAPDAIGPRAIEPDGLAYVSFTSGSTGMPKGIAGAHRPVTHFLDWHVRTFGLVASDRFSMLSGLAHDPLLRDVFAPLWAGASVHIPDERAFDSGDRLAAWLRAERVTVAHLTPAMGQLISQASNEAAALPLRYAFFGGEALAAGDVSALTAHAPMVRCVNFYGATETPQAIAFYDVSSGFDCAPAAPPDRSRVLPIGKGIEGVQLLLLNGAGRLAGIGERAEICVRTPYLALGYLGGEANDRFTSNPLTGDAADRLYRTNDFGRYNPDGLAVWQGRGDRQVKLRGYRIELGDVERALTGHPAVSQAYVMVTDDANGAAQLSGYCVAGPTPPSSRELRDWVRSRVPEYMVPSAVVCLQAFPLTPNGKIDRGRLSAASSAAAPVNDAPAVPLSPVEEALEEIWRGLLRIERAAVAERFFDLG